MASFLLSAVCLSVPRYQVSTNRLSLKKLRELEREFGIYFDRPWNQSAHSEQRLRVYGADEQHLGDLIAKGEQFEWGELVEAIRKLIEK